MHLPVTRGTSVLLQRFKPCALGQAWVKFQMIPWLAMWSLASHLTSVNLSDLACEVGPRSKDTKLPFL